MILSSGWVLLDPRLYLPVRPHHYRFGTVSDETEQQRQGAGHVRLEIWRWRRLTHLL